MANVKTAISLEESLFHQIETLAQEMQIPRSRLFALAVEEFLQRRKSENLLESLNSVYASEPDSEDQVWLEWARTQQRKLLEQDEW